MSDSCPVIFSLAGPDLSAKERDFFKEAGPLGFILFSRNVENPDQLRALTANLKDALGRDCPVLIDQEGGRVQRMKPPHWRAYPPMQDFGDLARGNMDKALSDLRYTILQLAEELRACGINVDCTPVVDVLCPETHDVIGDRAFADDERIVARLGLSVCRTMLAAGVTPVIKHIPGHGCANADSHKDLPHVEIPRDKLEKHFHPFREIAKSDVGAGAWAMTAHVVYNALDPYHPASVSKNVIENVIRKEIGFDGLLVSDDLDMDALRTYGSVAARGQAVLAAGCDIALYCSGKMKDMEKIADSVPKMSKEAQQRLQKSEEFRKLTV